MHSGTWVDTVRQNYRYYNMGVASLLNEERIERLEKEGFVVLNREPKIGADNKWVVFLHPKSSNGVLVELCQERN